MKRISTRNKIYFYLISLASGLLLLFTFYYFFHYLFPYSNKNVIEIEGDWMYSMDSKSEMKPLDNFSNLISIPKNKTLYLSIDLPSDHEPVLLIKSYYQFINIYINENLQYANPPKKEEKPGTSLHFVDISTYPGSPTLRLEITSPYQVYSGQPSSVYMGEAKALYGFILKEAFLPLFFLFICTSTGILLIILFFLRWLQHKNDRNNQLLSAFFFGLFSILWGFFSISRENIIYFIFPPVTASLLAIGLHIVYFIPLMGYFYCHLTTLKRMTRTSLFLFCGMACTSFLLQFFEIADFPDMLFLINPLQEILFIPYIIAAFIEYKKGNPFVKHILPAVLILITTAVGTIADFYIGIHGYGTELFISCTFCLILIIWTYYIKGFYQKRIDEKNEIKALLLKNKMTEKNYNEISLYMEEVRMMRHEMNHHLGIIQLLCKDQDNSKISAYLSDASKEYSSAAVKYSNHILVDSILSASNYRAKTCDIKIEHEIRIPDHLAIKDADLFSLLMNMLENAIEAASEIPDKTERYIYLKILCINECLLITCKNSYHKKIDKNQKIYITTKAESDSHGYGIVIMKSIVKKYNSMLQISYDDKEFYVKTVIPNIF